MANPEHIQQIRQGVTAWNKWRKQNEEIEPDLSGIKLDGAFLNKSNFSFVNLANASLKNASLLEANFRGANLSGAYLNHTGLQRSDLKNADLSSADFTGAKLIHANLSYANLRGAKFNDAYFGWTTVGETNLGEADGLETVVHFGPSIIGIETLYKAQKRIPAVFLRGCGIPDSFLEYLPWMIGNEQVLQFYSCFISYTTKDETFAETLYKRLRDAHIRVWFASEDIKGGEKIHEQIEHAIQIHDRLLIILSEHSLQSEWVMTEIRNARKVEMYEQRRKLFPIRLVDMETIKAWKCFDTDSGKDLAVEVREYFIPDFSNWKNPNTFEKALDRLLKDLRSEEKK
jgi:uncharacterized protein YjbI with pentapeptide repeats